MLLFLQEHFEKNDFYIDIKFLIQKDNHHIKTLRSLWDPGRHDISLYINNNLTNII